MPQVGVPTAYVLPSSALENAPCSVIDGSLDRNSEIMLSKLRFEAEAVKNTWKCGESRVGLWMM